MDEQHRAIPGWFTFAAIGALLWEVLGCGIFLLNAFADRAEMPLDQRAVLAATPSWMFAAWAFAVMVGLAGAVLLVMRHRRSDALLGLSLLALIVQLSGLLLVPQLRELIGSDDLFMPFVVLVISYGVWHFARHARREGWLR